MRIGMRGLVAVVGLCLAPCLAPCVAAQERHEEHQVQPPPGVPGAAEGAPSEMSAPPAPPPGPTEADVRGQFYPPAGAGRDPARVAQSRLVALENGTARLQFPDGEALVRVGSVIGGDVVKSVRGRQILLERRPAAGASGGEGLVVVTFGADGRARVRVFWTKDPSAAAAPEVR
jgi:hypothetical protein